MEKEKEVTSVLDTIMTAAVWQDVIPSTKKTFKYRGYTVGEEQALLVAKESKDTKVMIDNSKEIIKKCTFDTVDPDKLSSFDIEWILLKLRSVSVGEEADVVVKCEHCGKNVDLNIKLNEVKMPEVKNGANVVNLNDKVKLVLKYPGFEILEEIADSKNDIFGIVASLIQTIMDGDEVYESVDFTPEQMRKFIRNMNSKSLTKITDFITSNPRLEYSTEVMCLSCSKKSKIELRGIRNFFS